MPRKTPAKKKSKAELHREKVIRERQLQIARKTKAVELYQQGWIIARIAQEIGVGPPTIAKWLNAAGVPRTFGGKSGEKRAAMSEAELKAEQSEIPFVDARLAEREEERQAIAEVAENQASPADQYQAFVAANGIKIMRDNMMNVRGPRTIRELSELDQIIRRNMGLSPRGGQGGAASLTIDISILNNPKASRAAANQIVEAKLADDDETEYPDDYEEPEDE